jgi:DNA polymerase III alpha subunit
MRHATWHTCTFSTFQTHSALRDVAAALDLLIDQAYDV